ncbi:MAG: 2-amino-4-hydroxy-6-hydroxymethyldihydropteridine diphosphokinase [Candidatus Krumholzibacteriia bacterium]
MRDSPAYLSLGSNVGARESALLSAVRSLETEGIARLSRVSSLYETEPVACDPMDDFANVVVEVQPLLCPEDLLIRLQMLEQHMGRRGGHNEPRTVDIDIVAVADQVLKTADLEIPHPRYRERAFVLVPLGEIAPGFTCPVTGKSVSEMIQAIAAPQRVTLISARRMICQ